MTEQTERSADLAGLRTADGADQRTADGAAERAAERPVEGAAEQPANAAAGRERRRPHVAIITGLSGAGKTQASKLLEDEGYSVVDNLPSELLRDLAELAARDHVRFERLALVLDARAGNAPHVLGAALAAL
jgi:P-loop ATPase protein family